MVGARTRALEPLGFAVERETEELSHRPAVEQIGREPRDVGPGLVPGERPVTEDQVAVVLHADEPNVRHGGADLVAEGDEGAFTQQQQHRRAPYRRYA